MDARRWRWPIDLAAWAAIWWFGVFVGAWWVHHGDELMARLAAWSAREPDRGRPAVPAKMGPRKRAYFDRLEKIKDSRAGTSPPG